MQECSTNMVDLEIFIYLFRLLDETDRAIIERYIQGHSVKDIAHELGFSRLFVSEKIYLFQHKLEKEQHEKNR